MNESDVRKWLRRVWGKGLTWVEAGRGGSVGFPDVILPLASPLPVELKYWHRTRKGIRCDIRPSQIRYHTVAAREGHRTAFLVGVTVSSETNLFAFPGHRCPVEPYADLSMWRVGSILDTDDAAKLALVSLFESEQFWKS